MERHAEQGLCIGPETGQIDWWGERLDAGAAVAALLAGDHDEEPGGVWEPALTWGSVDSSDDNAEHDAWQ
jgi:hypothetical protein